MSEKIVLLDEQTRALRTKEVEFESRMEQMVQEKANLLTVQVGGCRALGGAVRSRDRVDGCFKAAVACQPPCGK